MGLVCFFKNSLICVSLLLSLCEATVQRRNITDYMPVFAGDGFDITIQTGLVKQPDGASHPLEGEKIMWAGVDTRWSAERAAAGFKMFKVDEYPTKLWKISNIEAEENVIEEDMGPNGWLNTLFYLSDYVTTQRQSCVEPYGSMSCQYLDYDLNTKLNHTSCFTALINQRRIMIYGEPTFTLTKDTIIKITYDNGWGEDPLKPNTPLLAGHRIIRAHFSSKKQINVDGKRRIMKQILCSAGDVKKR